MDNYTPSVFLTFFNKKRLTIYLIIKRLWILYPLSIYALSSFLAPLNNA
jgi:hypothetical protein